MDELAQMVLDDTSAKMDKSIQHLESELGKIRAGRVDRY